MRVELVAFAVEFGLLSVGQVGRSSLIFSSFVLNIALIGVCAKAVEISCF